MARTGSRFTWRVALLGAVFVLSTLGIVGRLVQIQIIDHQSYQIQAKEEHLDKRPLRAERGAILDRNGFPLATSLDVFDLYIDRRAWKDDAELAASIARKIAPLLGEDPDQLLARLIDDSAGPVELLAAGIEFGIGLDIESLFLPGLTLAGATERSYPEGDVGTALLGFLGRDHIGLAGLEADLEEILGGTPGAIYFERDGGGDPIAAGQSRIEPGRPGADVSLTIDRYIQRLIEIELDYQIEQHEASGGTILVMDPKTGAILGMASRPSIRISELSLEDPNLESFRNRAVTDLYEPGSVLKVVTMATALDLGLVKPKTTYVDTGTVERGGFTFANWDFSANGETTMTELLQKSLNTGAIWLSDQIGADRLYASLQRFGFGESTHSGLAGESTGLLRTNQDADWYEADLATNSYGQGIAVTPLQVVTALSSLINGGNLMRPYIVQEINGPSGRRIFEPVVVRQTVSPETSATITMMMNAVVDGVLFHGAKVEGYQVGGKTGTTLVSVPTGYALDSTIASFVGFAPLDQPAFIMLVKIDQPQDDPLGGVVAAPVFGRLAPLILAYLNIQPTNQQTQSGR